MSKPPEQADAVALLNAIRVETALSRYPVHRLAKKGNIAIDLQEKDEQGEITLKWHVTYNSGFGHPGPLAYKVDTLIVNRRIEESPRPLPRIIRLGKQREICRELGINEGQGTRILKNALHQNASAYITARISYRTANGGERTLELGDTRYGVVFTGQTLPDGRKADAVYIILHDGYKEILDSAKTRPLDYDYLKSLAPAPQRFYEILSYQIYAAIKYGRTHAKLTYSDLCIHAPQTRHLEWEKVRSQMNKIHKPHQDSGYIAKKVDFHQTTDKYDQPDWIMLYTPGAKARAECRAFTKRVNSAASEEMPAPANALPLFTAPTTSPLERLLIERGIHDGIAARLVRDFPESQITDQIEFLDFTLANKPKKIADPAAFLVKAIERNHGAPKGFVSKAELQRREETKRLAAAQATEEERRKRAQEARERDMDKQVARFRQSQTPEQLAQHEANAIAAASEETRRTLDDPQKRRLRKMLLKQLTDEHIARLLQPEPEPA